MTCRTVVEKRLQLLQERNNPSLELLQLDATKRSNPILVAILTSESDLLQGWEEQKGTTDHLAGRINFGTGLASILVVVEDSGEEELAEGTTNFQLCDTVNEAGMVGLDSRNPVVELIGTVHHSDELNPEDV